MMFSLPINYVEPVFRPPSEGRSLLIQVTIGCSNNKCTYCDMYRSKSYRERDFSEIKNDLLKLKDFYGERYPRKIFFCDGDALGAPVQLLTQTLDAVNELFPKIERVGIYATAENILGKTLDELKLLHSKKLSIAYLGMESGCDKVLHRIVKGNTQQDMIEGALRIKKAGFELSTIAMLGVGGQDLSKSHVEETAKVIELTSPEYFSFLTTKAIPGTPYEKQINNGQIRPLTSRELLTEMREILANIRNVKSPILFRANHVSNMYPLGGELPRDTRAILEILDKWIESTPEGVYPELPDQM